VTPTNNVKAVTFNININYDSINDFINQVSKLLNSCEIYLCWKNLGEDFIRMKNEPNHIRE